jgi:hypothetical protein
MKNYLNWSRIRAYLYIGNLCEERLKFLNILQKTTGNNSFSCKFTYSFLIYNIINDYLIKRITPFGLTANASIG